MDDLPPSFLEHWSGLPLWKRLRIFLIVWLDVHHCPPLPIHFSLIASLSMLFLLNIVPLHPMSLVVVWGGALSIALILTGGLYARKSKGAVPI
jgi:hypothetical protein